MRICFERLLTVYTSFFVDHCQVRFVEMKISGQIVLGWIAFETPIALYLLRAHEIDWHDYCRAEKRLEIFLEHIPDALNLAYAATSQLCCSGNSVSCFA